MNQFLSILSQFKNIKVVDISDLEKEAPSTPVALSTTPPENHSPTQINTNPSSNPSTDTNNSNNSNNTNNRHSISNPSLEADPNQSSNSNSDPNNNPVIIYSNNWKEGQMLNLASTGRYQTFLNSNSKIIESELVSCLKIHTSPKEFLTNPLPFWFPKGSTSLILPFQTRTDKYKLVNQFENFLTQTESLLVQENARILFEELFMNATIDAPSEAKKIGLDTINKGCELIAAHDHEKFVISIFDSYGALDPKAMVVRISKILLSENTKVINFDRNQGGAGIGSSLLFRYSSTLSIVVERGRGTRVSCTIPLKTSQKKFDLLEKNLQFINIQSEGEINEKRHHA